MAVTGAEGLERVRADPPDVVLLDLRLPDQSGLEVYQQIRQVDARIPVIFVTMAKAADAAIEAMKQGAYDYLFKPLDLAPAARAWSARRWRWPRRMREPAVVAETAPDPDVEGAIVGSCPAMREVYKAIGRVAGQDVPVLITGESGTGKELVARAIYQHGPRAKAPFLAINCAAIPESLLESELFGHEKGAFTGADRRRIGKFEQCNGGTLFLDEIGDMPLALQAKILRLLQEQAFERVGGNETIRTDVRLIAATHRDLKAWSERRAVPPGPVLPAGRLHHPPAAAARAGRRPAAAGAALPAPVQPRAGAGGRRGRPGGAASGCAATPGRATSASCRASSSRPCSRPAARSCSRPSSRRSWPVRTGRRRAALPAEDLGLEAFIRQRLRPDARELYAETHAEVDRLLLPLVLEYAQGNLQQASRILGIARQTLRLKLRDLGLSVSALRRGRRGRSAVESEGSYRAAIATGRFPSGLATPLPHGRPRLGSEMAACRPAPRPGPCT